MKRKVQRSLPRPPALAGEAGAPAGRFPGAEPSGEVVILRSNLQKLSEKNDRQAEEIANLKDWLKDQQEALSIERLEAEADRNSLAARYQELHGQTDQYVDFHDFGPVGYLTLDRVGCIVNVNRSAVDLLRRGRTCLIGSPLLPLVAMSGRREFAKFLAKAPHADEPQTIELWFDHKESPALLLQLTGLRSKETSPGKFRIRATLVDITARKHAEEAVREKERQLELVTNLSSVMLSRCGRDLKYLFVNRACAQFLGRAPEEIVGQHIASIIGKPALGVIRPHIDAVRRGRSVEFEVEIPYAGPGSRFMHAAYIPEKDSKGRVRSWVAAIIDITKRREMEEALRTARDELEKRVRERTTELVRANELLRAEALARKQAELSQVRLAAIVESSLDAIVSLRLDGNVVSWNRGAERLFGYSREEIVGRPMSALVPSSQQVEFRQICVRVQAGEIVEALDTIRLRKSGQTVQVSETASPVRDSHGLVIGFSAIIREISQRKKAEQSLRTSEARFRGFVEAIPEAIVIVDKFNRMQLVNSRAERLFGYRREELYGETMEMLLSEKYRRPHEKARQSMCAGPKLRPARTDLELVGRRKDGSEFDFGLTLTTMEMPDGVLLCNAIRNAGD